MKYIEEIRASKILYNFLSLNCKGKKFLIPSNVCEIIPLTFYQAKINFEFIDIDKSSLCISQEIVEQRIQDIDGILYVHTYGVEIDMKHWFQSLLTKKNNLIIIDDCCLCIPTYQPTTYNLSASLAIYSLGYGKQVDMGSGSIGYMNDKFIYKQITVNYDENAYAQYKTDLLEHKQLGKDYPFLENRTFHLDLEFFNFKKDSAFAHRKKINTIYYKNLPLEIQMNPIFQNWRFNIILENLDIKSKIISCLFKNNLFASTHYISQSENWNQAKSITADNLKNHVINLFNDYHYSEYQAIKTCNIIKEIINKYDYF